MRPVAVRRCQIRCDCVGRSGRVALQRAALANTLVWLDVRAGRDFLQEDLDRFGACRTFEGERAGRLGHRDFLGLLLRERRIGPAAAGKDRILSSGLPIGDDGVVAQVGVMLDVRMA